MTMVTYIVLAKFTDQGIRNAKDSPKRADAFRQLAKTVGVTVKDLFWTQGRYDIVTIVEAPDESSAMSLNLSLGALGNVRTESLRAFSAADMTAIVGKMV
jgi:uncharacterized protein with GYD domain